MTVYQIIILALACIATYSCFTEGEEYPLLAIIFWVWLYCIYPSEEKAKSPEPKNKAGKTFTYKQEDQSFEWEKNH